MGELSTIWDARASPTGANTSANNRNTTRKTLKTRTIAADL